MSKQILLTGGGSSGHVTPNLALISKLQQDGWQVAYMGSVDGIEHQLITRLGIPYYSIQSGKLRRYFSWQNILDPFKVLVGILQACWHILRLRPNIVFSKGGFVALPVVIAAWLCRVPVIAHESDLSPGLATRLSLPFVKRMCLTFAAGKRYFKSTDKLAITGTPIRSALLQGNAERGREFCGLRGSKPVVLIFGGGLGAQAINVAVVNNLESLLSEYQIIHVCGKSKLPALTEFPEGYRAYEYVHEEFADLFALADIVVSRAGANSVYELLALHKPHLLIPLPAYASRGDQLQNAAYLVEQGLSRVLPEAELTGTTLLNALRDVLRDREQITATLKQANIPDGVREITTLITQYAK